MRNGFQEAKKLHTAAGVFLNLYLENGRILKLDFVTKPVEELKLHLNFVDLAGKAEQKGLHR